MSIANELVTRGWTQGIFVEADGRVCLFGAARSAVFGCVTLRSYRGSLDAYGQFNDVFEVLTDLCKARGYPGITALNDAPETTYDDVLRVAKEADEILGASS